MSFSHKQLQHLCQSSGPAFASPPSKKAEGIASSDDGGGEDCGTPANSHTQASGKDNDSQVGAKAEYMVTKVASADGAAKGTASSAPPPDLAKPVEPAPRSFEEAGFVPPTPVAQGAKDEPE